MDGQRATKPLADSWAEEALLWCSRGALRRALPFCWGPVLSPPRGVSSSGLLGGEVTSEGLRWCPAPACKDLLGGEGTPLRGPSSESGRPDGKRSWAAHRGDGMPSAVLRALGSLAEPAWTLAPGAATGGHPTQEDGRGPPQGSHGPKASSLPPDGGQVESSRGQWREKPARYEIAPQPQQHRTRG